MVKIVLNDSPNNSRWKWRLLLLFVGLLALGIRFYYVTHAQIFQPVNQANVRGDAVEYYNYALNLTRHGVFSKVPEGTAPLVSDSYRDPGYPTFLAGWMSLFSQWDSWYAAVLLSQALLSALTVVLTLCLARHWMPMTWLAAAGMLMAIWPHNVTMSGYLLTETLFGFLVALGLLLLRIALDRSSAVWAAACGISLSLGALTNAVLLPFVSLLALYLLLRRKISIAMFSSLVIAGIALTAPWVIRNNLLPPSGTSSSGRALVNLVVGSWPSYHSAYQAALNHDPNGLIIMAAVDRETAAIEAHPMAGLGRISHRMADNPGEYIRWYLSKPALLWSWDIRVGQGDIYVYPVRNSPFQVNTAYRILAAVSHALNPWLFVLAMAGCLLVLLAGRKIPSGVAATALTLVLVTGIYTVLQAEPRYSAPFRGMEIVLAIFTAYWGVHAFAAQKRRQAKLARTPIESIAKETSAARKPL
jgi:4-amino-4-deoxy-L-arabinose transferase-like glycosyltransferase